MLCLDFDNASPKFIFDLKKCYQNGIFEIFLYPPTDINKL